jgi:hypothetical protein
MSEEHPVNETERWILRQPKVAYIETGTKIVHAAHIVYEKKKIGAGVDSFSRSEEIVNAYYAAECTQKPIIGKPHKEIPPEVNEPASKMRMCDKCNAYIIERDRLAAIKSKKK